MEKEYIKPEIEIVTLARDLMQELPENSGVTEEEAYGKQNDMWEESSDPIFESNKKNLWDE
jgi:hypothetical protein